MRQENNEHTARDCLPRSRSGGSCLDVALIEILCRAQLSQMFVLPRFVGRAAVPGCEL